MKRTSLYIRIIQKIKAATKESDITVQAHLDALEWHVERLEMENIELKRQLGVRI